MKTNVERNAPRGAQPGCRNQILWSALIAVFAGTAGMVRAQTTILQEDFEGAFPGAWGTGNSGSGGTWLDVWAVFGGDAPHGGNYKGYCDGTKYGRYSTEPSPVYDDNMRASMTRSVSLSGYTSATLTFWYKIPSIETNWDFARVYISDIEGSIPLWSATTAAPEWTKVTIDLDPYIGIVVRTINFQFESDGSNTREGWYLDDIRVTGYGIPGNDLCPGATTVDACTSYGMDTHGATSTSDPVPSCQLYSGNGVWFKHMVPVYASVTATTAGSDFDTVIQVYRGTCGALTPVACNDDVGTNRQATVTFNSTAGETYYFLVGGYNGARGALQFQVRDYDRPQVTCPADIYVQTDPGQCSRANVTYSASATDNCGVPAIEFSPPSGSTFPKGTTPVICTARDGAGNTSTCTFSVVVQDQEKPHVTCPGNIVTDVDGGLCSKVVTFSATATDNCPGVSVSCNPPSGTAFPKGLTTVFCTATDASANTNICSFTVTVRDTELPQVYCPTNILAYTDPGQCSKANVTFTATATDNCPGVSVSCNPPSGSIFPKGTNTVVCTATDTSGNSRIRTFTVTVLDSELPQVYCPSDIVAYTDSGQCSKTNVTFTATASDNCPGASVSCYPPSGSTFAKGVTPVVCTATDASGNSRTNSFTVTVLDAESPQVYCPSDFLAYTDPGQCSKANVTFTVTATDNCPGVSLSCTPPSGSSFAKGVTPVVCTATDSSGNSRMKSFTVTVLDNELPQVLCPTNIVDDTDPGQSSKSNVTWTATATDNCPGVSVSFNPPSGSSFPEGVTTVVCTAVDSAGNSNACGFTVTIQKAIPTNALVYVVTHSGATYEQATNLAALLGLPVSRIGETNGLVLSIDPTNWLSVPTVPLTNQTVISNLLAFTTNPGTNPIVFHCLDFDRLGSLLPPDEATALATASNALAASGLMPQFGAPGIGHTILTAFYTNTGGTVSSTYRELDTQVQFELSDGNGVPLVGPGAQVHLTFGASNNVTRLRYASPQLVPGNSVAIISPAEATNRVAHLFPAGTDLSAQLTYWVPDPRFPAQFWTWTHPNGPPPPATLPPLSVLPYYVIQSTQTNPIAGSNDVTYLGMQMIPASDETNVVPAVSLSAVCLEQTQVVATATVTGGTPPYFYMWSGSDHCVSTNTGPSIAYTPKVRITPPPLAIAYPGSGNSVMLSWPYPSSGFDLEFTTNLDLPLWSVVGSAQTNNDQYLLEIPAHAGSSFFRLRLDTNGVSTTETVAVTVMDANGVVVTTNQTFAVRALPYPPIPEDPPSFGTEAPFSSSGSADLQSWIGVMQQHGCYESFRAVGSASRPGDFVAPGQPGGWQLIPSIYYPPSPPPPDHFFALADSGGIDTANLTLYIGGQADYASPTGFYFTWAADPNSYHPSGFLQLTAGTKAQYYMYGPYWEFDLAYAWGNQQYYLLKGIPGRTLGPQACLNWLVFDCSNLLQYNSKDWQDQSPPNSGGFYPWQRWGGTFNGLHMMLGFESPRLSNCNTPATFGKNLYGWHSYPWGDLQFFLPSTILQAWFDACLSTQPQWMKGTVYKNGVPTQTNVKTGRPAAMGPMGPNGVCDFNDFWPGTGFWIFSGTGPDISPAAVQGWWYLTTYFNPPLQHKP